MTKENRHGQRIEMGDGTEGPWYFRGHVSAEHVLRALLEEADEDDWGFAPLPGARRHVWARWAFCGDSSVEEGMRDFRVYSRCSPGAFAVTEVTDADDDLQRARVAYSEALLRREFAERYPFRIVRACGSEHDRSVTWWAPGMTGAHGVWRPGAGARPASLSYSAIDEDIIRRALRSAPPGQQYVLGDGHDHRRVAANSRADRDEHPPRESDNADPE